MPDCVSTEHRIPLVFLDEIDSTNAEALRRAGCGERGPLWICTSRQTRGRGRSGRSWTSAEGSLAASLLFQPECSAAHLPELSLLAGVAAIDAIGATWSPFGPDAPAAAHVRLKWPNDLLVGGGKLGGILVECANYGVETVAVAGIGINVTTRPDVDGRAVACLADHGIAPAPLELAQALSVEMQRWLDIWCGGERFASVREAWLRRAGPEGEPLAVNTSEGRVAGAFAGLDNDGALLMIDERGNRRRFAFGDVTLMQSGA